MGGVNQTSQKLFYGAGTKNLVYTCTQKRHKRLRGGGVPKMSLVCVTQFIPAAGRFSRRPNHNATSDSKMWITSSPSSFRRRENQKRETSSQSEGSEIIEGVLWVHGAWENGEHRIFLMLGHGFREISTLFIILSEPNMSETEDQIKTVPIQCRYPFYTGADLRPVKAPWAPLVYKVFEFPLFIRIYEWPREIKKSQVTFLSEKKALF